MMGETGSQSGSQVVQFVDIMRCVIQLVHQDIYAMLIYLYCILCDVKNGYNVFQSFLLC